jgi:hypothetical protein
LGCYKLSNKLISIRILYLVYLEEVIKKLYKANIVLSTNQSLISYNQIIKGKYQGWLLILGIIKWLGKIVLPAIQEWLWLTKLQIILKIEES